MHSHVTKDGGVVLLEDYDSYRYNYADLHEQHITPGMIDVSTRHMSPHHFDGGDWYPPPTTPTFIMSSFEPTIESKNRPTGITTVSSHASANTAIQPGGAVNIFTCQYIGYALNWLLIGITSGLINALVYPVFSTYLNYETYRVGAVSVLFGFAWNFKFVLGFITDCFPINRYRRKPYIYVGWTVFGIIMIVLMGLGNVEPYEIDDEIVNEKASSEGERYVVPLMLASFAVGLVTVACEGMMVEFAHREPINIRGKVQCKSLFMRYLGTCFGTYITGSSFNGPEYGGTYGASVPLTGIFGMLAGFSVVGLIVTYFFFVETPTRHTRQPLISQLLRMWRVLQRRPSWQLMCYGFLQAVTMNFKVVESTAIYQEWLNADTISRIFANALSGLGGAVAVLITSKYWLNRDWRAFVLIFLAISVALELPTELLTIFDVFRNIYFYYFVDHVQWVLDALIMLPPLFVIVEIAEPGLEAMAYATITTIFHLAAPVVTTTTNLMGTFIHHHVDDLADDTSEIRWHVARETLFEYGLRVVLIVATIWLLPRQKRHVQELTAYGNSSLVIPVAIFLALVVLFVAAVTSNLMSVSESTSCYRFAGGQGC